MTVLVDVAGAIVTCVTVINGVKPNFSIALSDAINNAAAPSLSPDELPAVTDPLPSERNAGLSFAKASNVVRGLMNSSLSTCFGSLLRCGIVTGTISAANRPPSRARAAFSCEANAKQSWSALVTP